MPKQPTSTKWFAGRISIGLCDVLEGTDFRNKGIAVAETPELAKQIADEHNAHADLVATQARYDWMLEHPDAARHLLRLLDEQRGDKASFGAMIDRIMVSAAAAASKKATA